MSIWSTVTWIEGVDDEGPYEVDTASAYSFRPRIRLGVTERPGPDEIRATAEITVDEARRLAADLIMIANQIASTRTEPAP